MTTPIIDQRNARRFYSAQEKATGLWLCDLYRLSRGKWELVKRLPVTSKPVMQAVQQEWIAGGGVETCVELARMK